MGIIVGRKKVTISKEDLETVKKALNILENISVEIEYKYGCLAAEMSDEMRELYDAITIDTETIKKGINSSKRS